MKRKRNDSLTSNRNNTEELEEGNKILLDFTKLQRVASIGNILPVIVQNFKTKEVLMLAYITPEALNKSIELKKAVFYSTTRNELWIKGDSSGNYLEIKEIRVNCEQNSLLFLVLPINDGVCHTLKKNEKKNRETCFYRKIEDQHLEFLKEFY
jgi:phosphoribosyl-AMP cyclohydrolase